MIISRLFPLNCNDDYHFELPTKLIELLKLSRYIAILVCRYDMNFVFLIYWANKIFSSKSMGSNQTQRSCFNIFTVVYRSFSSFSMYMMRMAVKLYELIKYSLLLFVEIIW